MLLKYTIEMFETRKPRPVTSAALARRLVSGALGLKVNASKEQREIERNMLKEAKGIVFYSCFYSYCVYVYCYNYYYDY